MQAAIDLRPGRSAPPVPRAADIPRSCGDQRLAALRADHARLSARAAQARGRGEWALAAQVAAQMAALEAELPSARGR